MNLNIRLCRSTTEPSVNLTLGLINLILLWETTSGSICPMLPLVYDKRTSFNLISFARFSLHLPETPSICPILICKGGLLQSGIGKCTFARCSNAREAGLLPTGIGNCKGVYGMIRWKTGIFFLPQPVNLLGSVKC